MSNNQQFEREFEKFLNEEDSRIAALYRKLPRPEPDAKLDASVLAMARRAAATAPRPRAHTPRWIPALSAAAVVALAAGIAFRTGPTVWQQQPAPAAQKPVGENAAAPAPAAAHVETNQRTEADALKDQAAPQNAIAPAPRSDAVPAAPPAYSAPAGPETRALLRKMEPPVRRADAPAPQAFPKRAAQEQEKKPAETGAAAGASAPMQQSGAVGDLDVQARDRTRDESSQSIPERPALKAREEKTTRPMPVETPPPPPAREQPVPQSAPTDAAAESTIAAPAAKTLQRAPRSKDPNARLYPEHWLENIRTMLREDQRDEALRSLAEFRRLYPNYHLPDDLRDLK